jgi:hypothetical protein
VSRRLLTVAGKKREEGIEIADFASVYGINSIPDYLTFVRLYLNIPRIHSVKNFHSTVSGIIATQSHPIPDEWITAAIPENTEASAWRRWDLQRTLPS